MDKQRRQALKAGGSGALMMLAAAAGLVKPEWAQAADWNKAAFDGKTIASVAQALGGPAPVQSREIELIIPEIADDGAAVPVAVSSKLPKTQAIGILVEKNPNALAAYVEIGEGVEPYVATVIKMAQTAGLTALVKADGKYYFTTKEIKVTFDGCA